MKLFKWSLSKIGIAILVFIITAILGRWLANYNIRKEFNMVSSVNTEPQKDTDNIVNTGNLVYIDGKLVDTDTIEGYPSFLDDIDDISQKEQTTNEIITKNNSIKVYTVQAEVWRVVNNHYKDAHRKETIEIVTLSNGVTLMKKYFDAHESQLGTEHLSSLPGYEYECYDTSGQYAIIYAYNEGDKKLVTK